MHERAFSPEWGRLRGLTGPGSRSESRVMSLTPFLAAAGIAGVLTLGGCRDAVPRDGGETGARSFALFLQARNNPVFQDIRKGLETVITARGDRLRVYDAQFSSTKQRNDIAAALEEKPAALFLNPVNWEGARASLIAAHRRGVPVIVVDAPVSDPELVLCQVASDNPEAGRLVCTALAAVKPQAGVVILHLSLNRACIDRVQGFKAEMARHPGMRILDVREGKGRAEGSYPVMKDLLVRYPELNAVFAVNDPSALGAIRAIEEAGRAGQVAVVSVDGSPAGIAAIRAGRLLASAAQSPAEIGRIAAEQAYAHLAGEAVEKNTRLPVALITAENAPPGSAPETPTESRATTGESPG